MSNYIYTNNGELVSEDELLHYGVPGMKWGHRKARPMSDLDRARSNYKAANKEYSRSYNKAHSYSARRPISQFINKKAKAESDRRWADAAGKAQKVNAAKNAYKKAKKSAVANYDKKFKDADKAQNVADKKWDSVQAQYKSLGKTKITRMLNAARGKSDAAKQYNKSYDSWEKSQNKADKKWSEAKKEYAKTGRNRIDRLFNNIKYGK